MTAPSALVYAPTTPVSLFDQTLRAERLAAEVAELSRPLWAEDEVAA